jgi:hypothetical protein
MVQVAVAVAVESETLVLQEVLQEVLVVLVVLEAVMAVREETPS